MEIDKRHKTAMMHIGEKCIFYANETNTYTHSPKERRNGRKTIKRMEHKMKFESLVVRLHALQTGKIARIINWHIGVPSAEHFQHDAAINTSYFITTYIQSPTGKWQGKAAKPTWYEHEWMIYKWIVLLLLLLLRQHGYVRESWIQSHIARRKWNKSRSSSKNNVLQSLSEIGQPEYGRCCAWQKYDVIFFSKQEANALKFNTHSIRLRSVSSIYGTK